MRKKSTFWGNSAKKIFSALFTQGVIFVLSFVTGIIIPKYMGPESFAFWQVYVIYLTYINLLGLGYNDGLVLIYGGKKYDELPFKRIRSGTYIFYIYIAVMTVLILSVGCMFITDAETRHVVLMLAVNVPSVCLQCITLSMFLAVNKTAIYNAVSFFSKFSAVAFYLVIIALQLTTAKNMMFADALARLLMSFVCLIAGRRFLLGKEAHLKEGIKEFFSASRAGIKITVGIIASSLIPVVGRIVVEQTQPRAAFGIYSFVMSIITIIVTFANTAGLVVFPILKTLKEDLLPKFYLSFSYIFSSLCYVIFIAYIPAVFLIRVYLTDYLPALSYLHILLVGCLPIGKVQLLITSYYKAFRLEKAYATINLAGLAAVYAATCLVYYFFSSVQAIAWASTVMLFLWQSVLEVLLVKKMNIKRNYKELLQNLFMMAAFIITGSFQDIFLFGVVYGLALFGYILVERKQLLATVKNFRSLA